MGGGVEDVLLMILFLELIMREKKFVYTNVKNEIDKSKKNVCLCFMPPYLSSL